MLLESLKNYLYDETSEYVGWKIGNQTIIEDLGVQDEYRVLVLLDKQDNREEIQLGIREEEGKTLFVIAPFLTLDIESCLQEKNEQVEFVYEETKYGNKLRDYIKRYAPKLINASEEIVLIQYPSQSTEVSTEQIKELIGNICLYLALLAQYKRQAIAKASGLKRPVYRSKVQEAPTDEVEPTFAEASRGAFIAAAIFFIAWVVWFFTSE